MGVTLDPSYAFPLPIFGIDYLNFHFGSPNQQLAILFAGVLAAGNIQRSKIGNTHLDASVDFFAIAAPSSDRVYGPDGEAESERVLTWPLSTGFNLGWQATPFQKATLQYQVRFDGYVKDRTTAENFDVPSSTVTQGIGGAWEYRRGGYSLLLNGTWFGRAAWKPWGVRQPGEAAATTTSPRTYAKYSAGLSRDFYLNAVPEDSPERRVVQRPRSRSVRASISSGCSTTRGFTACRRRASATASWRWCAARIRSTSSSSTGSIFSSIRPGDATTRVAATWEPISGFGIAVNVRAPWNTILRADCRQERAARALRPARLDDAADHVAEAAPMTPTLRADLHVHTCHSKVSGTLPFLGSRDCYSTPADVYRVAKARGMDLVAFTDHDSIDGALELLNDRPDLDRRDRRRRGVVPAARRRHRRAPRRLRHDRGAASRPAAAARQRLRRHRAPARGGRLLRAEPPAAFLSRPDPARALPAAARRGAGARSPERRRCCAAHNALVEQLARTARRRCRDRALRRWWPAATRTRCGASARRGPTAPGRTRDEFLASLRQGLGRARRPRTATTATVAGDAYGVIATYVAALAGFGPRDLPPLRRAAAWRLPRVSLPFQFMPLAIAANGKARERREVAHADRSRTPPAWCRRRREASGVQPGVVGRMSTARRDHRRRPGHGARRDARGELAPDARGRVRHSRRRPSSTQRATAAASPPRSTWTAVDAGLDTARTAAPVAERSHRRARRGRGAR